MLAFVISHDVIALRSLTSSGVLTARQVTRWHLADIPLVVEALMHALRELK
jgi:hypothetical protein